MLGLLEMIPHTLAGFQPNHHPQQQNYYMFDREKDAQRLNNEKIPYNDCLYRSLNRSSTHL